MEDIVPELCTAENHTLSTCILVAEESHCYTVSESDSFFLVLKSVEYDFVLLLCNYVYVLCFFVWVPDLPTVS